MSPNMNDMHPQPASHSQINRTRLRTMGTFLVPIGAMVLLFSFFPYVSSYLNSKFPDYGKLSHLAIQWSGLSFYPWGMFTGLIGRILILVIAFVFLYKSEKFLPKDFGLVWSSGQKNFKETIKLNIVIIVSLFLFFAVIFNFLYRVSGQETVDTIINFFFNSSRGEKKISAHVFGPAFEEILFRGIYCTLLVRHGLKWHYTILITGMIFGLVHLGNHQSLAIFYVIQPCFATVAGWFLGWIFYKTRTLMMPIVWHYVINIVIDFGAVRPDILAKIANRLIV